jgi:hypothetical protein
MQSFCDARDARLSNLAVVVLNLVFELVLFDEIGELITTRRALVVIGIVKTFVVGEDVRNVARTAWTLFVASLQTLVFGLSMLASQRQSAPRTYRLCLPRLDRQANEVHVIFIKPFLFLAVLALLAPSPLFAAHLVLIFVLICDEAGSFLVEN